MKINIETIPHDKQRYPTSGDYWLDENQVLQVRVSDTGKDDYNALIAIHELIELTLAKSAGISFKIIDNFDKDFEQLRKPEDMTEPGDAPNSPYRKQHLIATGVEKILAAELGVDWKAYDDAVNNL